MNEPVLPSLRVDGGIQDSLIWNLNFEPVPPSNSIVWRFFLLEKFYFWFLAYEVRLRTLAYPCLGQLFLGSRCQQQQHPARQLLVLLFFLSISNCLSSIRVSTSQSEFHVFLIQWINPVVSMSSDEGTKVDCKYGAECYQKNPAHLKKYNHPKKRERTRESEPPQKRSKNGDDKEPGKLADFGFP